MKPARTVFAMNSVAVLFLVLLSSGCRAPGPDPVDTTRAGSIPFHHAGLGLSLEYPDAWTVQADDAGEDICFRMNETPAVWIHHLSREEAEQRGLWARHEPQGEGLLDGRTAERYDYDHQDMLSVSRTVSWVVEYRDRYLAIEFREMDENLQQQILASIRLDG